MNARIALAAVLALTACKRSEKKDDGPSWLVGEEGEMLQFTANGDAEPYELDEEVEDKDLRSITCVGQATAWVVGELGTAMVTRDAGQSWDVVDVGTSALLAGVAAAELDEGFEDVWVVGQGVMTHSADGGATWTPVGAPALDWTGVSTDEGAATTIASAMDGSIWRMLDGRATQVFFADGEVLRSVSISHSGTHAAAVGDDGRMLVSHDGAATWSTIELPTTRDLHAVRISGDGNLVVAVGEAGVIARFDHGTVSAEETLTDGTALHGLHLRALGLGQAVGDNGVAMLTRDAGLTWEPVDTGATKTLYSVDDFHAGSHL